jgi:CheY-like chemotaxis protein
LVQVLNNLLSNAFKFTNKGQISFGYVKKDDCLEFFVKDTGSGIPLNMQKAVFERFRQLENQTIQKFRGTGLGLSISQKLVQLLGGEISLESQENIGTSFFFTIPYYTENSEIQKNEKEEFSSSKPSSNIYTILIAEDEEINFMFLSEILSNSGKRILHAKNGLEAIEICKKHPEIDLVLMDVKMPEMDGLQATRIIRDFRNQLPIIIQSAYVMESDKETAFLAGATGFIAKPINKNQLLNLVNKFLLIKET